jgi:hypothetical protein
MISPCGVAIRRLNFSQTGSTYNEISQMGQAIAH